MTRPTFQRLADQLHAKLEALFEQWPSLHPDYFAIKYSECGGRWVQLHGDLSKREIVIDMHNDDWRCEYSLRKRKYTVGLESREPTVYLQAGRLSFREAYKANDLCLC